MASGWRWIAALSADKNCGENNRKNQQGRDATTFHTPPQRDCGTL